MFPPLTEDDFSVSETGSIKYFTPTKPLLPGSLNLKYQRVAEREGVCYYQGSYI